MQKNALFLSKSNFSSDFRESDMDLVYFVARITGVKKLSISNSWLSLVGITLKRSVRQLSFSLGQGVPTY